MLLPNIGLTAVYTLIGVILLYVCYRFFDLLLTKIDFQEELKKGNVAVGIFIAALFIAIAIIIHGALS